MRLPGIGPGKCEGGALFEQQRAGFTNFRTFSCTAARSAGATARFAIISGARLLPACEGWSTKRRRNQKRTYCL